MTRTLLERVLYLPRKESCCQSNSSLLCFALHCSFSEGKGRAYGFRRRWWLGKLADTSSLQLREQRHTYVNLVGAMMRSFTIVERKRRNLMPW